MPFTPAHAAAVFPFLRFRRMSATALVAGSFSPDFEYFLKLSVDGQHGHTIPGLFYFDLPVTIILAFIFQLIVKKPLVENLPAELQALIPAHGSRNFVQHVRAFPLFFLISCLIGASTHIFWDGFTHNDGFFVRNISILDKGTIYFENVNYPLWYALQHVSTFAGLAVITGYVMMKDDIRSNISEPRMLYWLVLTGVMSVTIIARFYFVPEALNLGNFVVTAISGFCLGLIGSGILFHRKAK